MMKNFKAKRFFLTFILFALFLNDQSMVHAQRDIYLIIGQSNASGRADIEAQDMVSLPGVDLYNGMSWESAVNIDPVTNSGDGGMNRYSTIRNTNQTQGLSFAYTFGKMANEITGTQIGLVVNARGATDIDEWAQGATTGYYSEALARVNAALALGGSQFKGILWHQGEANRNDANYITKITALIAAFRTDFAMPNLPFIVGELSQQRTDNGNFNTAIRTISEMSNAAYIPFTEYVATEGLNTSDQTHFMSNGQRVLGYRYAAKALEMIYEYTYVQNQIMYVEQDAYVRGGSNATTAQEPLEPEIIRVKEVGTNANNTRRGLLEFNMTAISAIPNLNIVDASLLMTGNPDVSSGPIDISFYDLTNTWSESTVTYSSAPAFTTQLAASTTTFNLDVNDDDGDGDTDDLIHGGADITEFFKAKYALGTTNISLGLKSETDGSPQFKFSTKDDAVNFASRPYIVVSYLEPCAPTSGTDVITACDTYTWIDGVTYTASNNTATFTETNAAGCDSIVTLDLTINTATSGTDVITACDTYTWIDGVTYTTSNSTATFTETNAAGCDSIVTLDLTINNATFGTDVITACDTYTWIDGVTYTASNNTATFTETNAAGCDSIVTLDLTINTATSGADVITACDTYTWIDGVTYTASNNTATFTETNAAGCDSIVTLDLTINTATSGTDVITACETYTWIDGVTYTASNNTATFTETNAAGCDSIVTLDLTINTATSGTDVITACDTYTWIDGVTYTTSNNTATFTETNAAGCDSIVTLDLTINNATSGTDVITACDTYTWIDGVTYTASNNTATFTETNAAGCDSIVTLDLTINTATSGIDVITACETYTWIDGVTYTASNNTATFTETNAAGCDSIVTLDLTINNATSGTDVITACDTYTWIDGVTYTASNNTATFIETNTAGCDSIVTLDLTINTVNTATTTAEITITADLAGAVYQWIDCDNGNMAIAGETNQSFTATANGNYAVIVTENNCSDTSACTAITSVGLTEFAELSILNVYPNPSKYMFTVEGDVLEMATSISVVSIEGKQVYRSIDIENTSYSIDASDWTPGVYILTLETTQGTKIAKLIKE